MAKDKKKKGKNGKPAAKKFTTAAAGKASKKVTKKAVGTAVNKASRKIAKKAPKIASKSLKALRDNPMVADVVAAALVSMAAALKDTDKARRLANDAGDQLSALSKKSAKQGNAMWDLALDIGRRTLDTLSSEAAPRGRGGKAK